MESVFDLMDRVARLDRLPLWPGFEPAKVPVAVYDGANTYAFGFPALPVGFKPVEGRPGVGVFRGVHPQVRANRRITLDGVYAASCIAPPEAYLSCGRRDPAAVIMHEKFHVFQALAHPGWVPNDAHLFTYPADTVESVLFRRLEIEAFRRAVAAEDDEEARAWAACGLEHHDRRVSSLAPQLASYENEVQRLEGLAEYIEWQVMGISPLDQLYELDFAPGAVRNWGYVSGRWAGYLLDRFDPAWKNRLENGTFAHPREVLAEAVRAARGRRGFEAAEIASLRTRTERDFRSKEAAKEKMKRRFQASLGWRIEMTAGKNPLRLKFFLANQSEAISPREMIHRRWLTLGNETCFLEVTDQECLTVSDSPAAVRRIVIPGLKTKPRVGRDKGGKVVSAAGVVIRFNRAAVSQRANTLVIRLGK